MNWNCSKTNGTPNTRKSTNTGTTTGQPVHLFQVSRSGQAADLHDEYDRRVQPPAAESDQIQNRDPDR